MTASPNLNPKLTADEVNILIYSYLTDSGFGHAAYSLFNEAHLDRSPNRNISLPRGELISLLKKAVIFREVEEMQQNKGKAKEGPTSLLGRYRTAADGPLPELAGQTSNVINVANTSSLSHTPQLNGLSDGKEDENGRPKKRARTDDTDEEVIEVLNPNAVSSKKSKEPFRLKPGSVLPPDGSPPGTMILRGHEAEVFACQWNPTKPTVLVSGGKCGQVIIWNVPEPEPASTTPKTEARSPLHSTIAVLRSPDVTEITKELKDLTSMAWSKDGNMLAVGHQDATIVIWTHTGQLKASLTQHTAPVFDLAWSDDNTKLVSAGLDGLAILWDVSKITKPFSIWVHRGHGTGTCCLDAEWLGPNHYATCGTDKRIIVYSKDKPSPINVFDGHKDEVNQIRLSPDGVLLASVSDDKTAMIWDISKWTTESWNEAKMEKFRAVGGVGTFVPKLSGGHDKPVSMVQWSPVKHEEGYNLLATFSREAKTACIWDIREGTILRRFNEYSPGVPITRDLFTHCFDPSGRFYALGGVRFLVIYSIKTGKALWTWPFADSYVADIVWDRRSDGRRLAVAKENGLTVVIDITQLGIPELAEPPLKLGVWSNGGVGRRRIGGLPPSTPAGSAALSMPSRSSSLVTPITVPSTTPNATSAAVAKPNANPGSAPSTSMSDVTMTKA